MTHTANFLEEQYTPPHHHRGRLVAPFILGGVGLALIVYLIVAALGAGRVIAASLDARDEINQAQTFAAALEFDNAAAALKRAAADVERAQGGLIWLAPLKFVPWVGDQVAAVEQVLLASSRLIPALEEAVAIASEIVSVVERARELTTIPVDQEVTYLTLPTEVRRDLLRKIHQQLPEFERIKARLTLAELDLAELAQLTLAEPIAAAIEPFRVLLPELAETVDLLIPLAATLPELSGVEQPSRFLILYVNNSELRPGGGFIGTFGSLTMADGLPVALTSDDVYAIDQLVAGRLNTAPPAPIKKYLGVDTWYFRDANWSPDFSVSAEQALALLALERQLAGQAAESYDGVIAITPTAASFLLDLLGPLTIEDQTFTADNFPDMLEYQVGFGFAESGLPRRQRKDIVGQLTAEVIERVLNLPLSEWPRVIDAGVLALQEKHLLLYSPEAPTQDVWEGAGWAGVLRPDESDSLMVVDANLASLKSDPAVERAIRYRIRQIEDGRVVANLAITYNHTGDFDWKTTRYRTYTRVYVPLGSELIRSEGLLQNDKILDPGERPGISDVAEELGFTVFGGFTSIEPGESRTIEYAYYLPERIGQMVDDGSYQLNLWKQPGAFNHQLTVDVDFGKPLESAKPPEESTQFGDSKYLLNTIFDQDQEITIRY